MLPEAETFHARSIFDEYWRLWPAGHVVDEFKLTVTGAAFIAYGSAALRTALYQDASMARLHDHTLQRSTTIIGSK